MNDLPRQALRRIIAKYGKNLGGDAKRCEGLLKDYCGEYRREINVLTSAIEERIPLDLLAAGNSTPRELLLSKLARRLEDNLGLTSEAALWAIDSWALALGIVTEEEIGAREKKQNDVIPISPRERNQPLPDNSEIRPSNQNRQPQTLPPQGSPPIAKAPANSSRPASPQSSPKSSPPTNIPQSLPQPPAPAGNPAPKKYFRRFLGCLFILFLLISTGIALIFGVPYAIGVMRETQQQNETPRFPSR